MPSNFGVETSGKPLSQFINERGERITFESRYKLEEEIIWFKTLVKNAVNAEKFKEAEEIQRSLDQIEELQPLFPTADNLKNELTRERPKWN